MDEHQCLRQELERTKAMSEVQSAEMLQIRQECHQFELEIARRNKSQAALRETSEKLKRQANDLKDELTTAVWALQEAEAEEDALRSKLVSSPDRRKRDLQERRDRLEKEKEECARLEAMLQECKTATTNMRHASKEMQPLLTALQDLQEAALSYADYIRQMEETLEKASSIQKQSIQLAEATTEVERAIHRTDEKIVAQRKQHQMQLQAAQESLEMAKSQLLMVEKDRREGMLRLQEGEAEVRALEAAMEKESFKTDQEIASMVAEFEVIQRDFIERDNRRMALLMG